MGTGGPTDAFWIGQEIGGYRIDRRIGSGLTGDVYHAASPTLEPREVAIKVLNISRQLSIKQYQEFYARFEREAEILQRFQHPNILRILGTGQNNNTPYMILPYVDGGTLASRLEDGPLPPDTVSAHLSQLASALDYAHEKGVVHRDVKPANVLLTGEGNLVLTDFSIARLMDETQVGLTTSSNMMGTASYIAPEQVQNEKGVGPAADIYSLGVVLYQMMTGRLPFSANTLFALMQKHVTEAPPNPRQFRPELPEALAAVMLKSLAKNPKDRYASADLLVQDFEIAKQGIVPAGLTLNSAASLPTDYRPLDQAQTVRAPTRARPLGIPPGSVTRRATIGALVSIALVVTVIATLLLSHGGHNSTPGGNGNPLASSSTNTSTPIRPTATPYPPTITVGPGTPTPTPYPPTATPYGGGGGTGTPAPTSTLVVPTPTSTQSTPSIYGDGSDGPLTISSNTTNSPLDATCSGSSGSAALSFSNASGPFSFLSGKPVLIVQSQGSGAGNWMPNTIISAPGTTAGTLTLASPLNGTYSTGAQVIVLPQYTNVTVEPGVTWRPKPWDGSKGGILAFLANGTVSIGGTIDSSGLGFRGADAVGGDNDGKQGEGQTNSSYDNVSRNANGSGGGGGWDGSLHKTTYGFGGGGGAGGGNLGAGADGGAANGDALGGIGGNAIATSGLSFGGGGGGGGHLYSGTNAGAGGAGGGIVYIAAFKLVVTGAVAADGIRGGNATGGDGGGGGGGAGGSVHVKTQSATGTGNITANGGSGGQFTGSGAGGGTGGAGNVFVG